MFPLEQGSGALNVFEEMESEVRSYIRSFPAVFRKASGYRLWDTDGKEYIDFFSGAGALNYGHNPTDMKRKLIDYLQEDGISHSLDMATEAKERFLQRFRDAILKPRGLSYKVMFPGPTGTNAVESALKLARKATGRQTVIGFTNAFHGMTLGALAVTGNKFKRKGAGVPLHHAVTFPYDGYMGPNVNTLTYIENFLKDSGSGISLPAAVILETLQGEGGLNAASEPWLRGLAELCRRYGMLLIVDDIQMGCGRTGPFFSFEPFGLKPDIVCLSKSIGGYGLPMALTLFKPELDLWSPGEHNGTFRGNNLAFVTAAEALRHWENGEFEADISRKAKQLRNALNIIASRYPALQAEVRGRGLMQGIAFEAGIAERISQEAFKRGLVIETSGTDSEVIKAMPPLIIDSEGLSEGLRILDDSVKAAAGSMEAAVIQ
ncbi:diaminobutyrate--2-oxoglutarate transaminase [Cohnella lubricantis]|uniref:Diaminobutyrate--2-oxoglutarate transaminase n=1 Tax=Cohnella lubricantis TaxID=2163172 RepID=A0A841TG61_9BACL|nr:diaminobutyrate--2-oxoglutarate transaminase [Cohnella lubricantis]MBB6678220.1 diaminobutyrate--2-oxoglutarate transaminase [Cohnella lubricantis]MBP2120075.1 diaminobutyrate-2-oxoglutarate transaminase [Cohnella lubricantis]